MTRDSGNVRNITLIVKPTHACNLNCPYCYDKENREKFGKERMSFETVEQIARVFEGRVGQWIWHGGEPLTMGVDWLDKAGEKIWSIDRNISLDMQTNGTLITQDVIDMLKKYGIQAGLSFDGIKNEFTRKDTARFMEILRLLEINKEHYGCIMVITPQNIGDIIGEYEYSKRLDINLQMNPIFKVNGNQETTNIENELMIEKICEFFDYWIHDTFNPYMSVLCMEYVQKLLNSGRSCCEQIDCVGRWFGIHPNGKIQPCGRDWADDFYFGNIHDYSSPEEIEQHPNFIRFREETQQLLDNCSSCEWFYACHGGCYGGVFTAHGHFKEPEPEHCRSTKKILTHVYNRLNEIDLVNNYDEYNPILVKFLLKEGFRGLNLIKQASDNK